MTRTRRAPGHSDLEGDAVSADKTELDRQLDKGGVKDLPPNVPPGMLGEKGLNVQRVDTFEPSLNAGILQESSPETRVLLMLLMYLLVITFPVAMWLLWRERRRSLVTKVVLTVVGVAIYVAVWFLTRH